MLIQVVERGKNFMTICVRGTELQETTVCHAEENGFINETLKDVWEGRNSSSPHWTFSLSPLSSFELNTYDDNKVTLTGLADHPDFRKLFKSNFMRTMAYMLQEARKTNPEVYDGPSGPPRIFLTSDVSDAQMREANELWKSEWARLVGLVQKSEPPKVQERHAHAQNS